MRMTAVKLTRRVSTNLATESAATDAVSVTVVNSMYKYTHCLLGNAYLLIFFSTDSNVQTQGLYKII